MKIAGKDTSKYEEMEDRKVLGKFVSQAFRDERTRTRKKSGKSYSSKDENPPVMHLSTNKWNLSIWSDLAKRTFIALMDDGIDSIGAKQIFDKLMFDFLMFDFNRGFVQVCDNEDNNHKREKVRTKLDTNTTDKVDQKKKLKVVHQQSMINIEYPKWKQKIEQTLFSDAKSSIFTKETAAAEALSSLKYNIRPEMVVRAEAAHLSHEV